MAVFSPKKASKSTRYCSVPQCFSLASNARNLSFHSFPREDDVVFVGNLFGRVLAPVADHAPIGDHLDIRCLITFRPEVFQIGC